LLVREFKSRAMDRTYVGPNVLQKCSMTLLPLLNAAQREIGVAQVKRHKNAVGIEQLVMAQNVRMRIQHRTQHVATSSRSRENHKTYHELS
jgi:hypothetical protein